MRFIAFSTFLLTIIINVIGAVPILYFDFPFRVAVASLVATIYMFIGSYSRYPIIILYTIGLIYVISMPQDFSSVIYYILFGLVTIFEIIPFIIGFIKGASAKR